VDEVEEGVDGRVYDRAGEDGCVEVVLGDGLVAGLEEDDGLAGEARDLVEFGGECVLGGEVVADEEQGGDVVEEFGDVLLAGELGGELGGVFGEEAGRC